MNQWTNEMRDAGLDKLASCLANITGPTFCLWRLEPDGEGRKPRKVPYLGNGGRLAGSYSDPELPGRLMTLSAAIAMARRGSRWSGIGLVFYPGCGVVGLDVDHCFDGERATFTGPQREALTIFRDTGCFYERSVSGTGLHAIALGDGQTVKANGVLELFGDKNFLALTGHRAGGVAG